eukprot:11295349-Alexandrium_andersonii.AAC.1
MSCPRFAQPPSRATLGSRPALIAAACSCRPRPRPTRTGRRLAAAAAPRVPVLAQLPSAAA